MKMKIMTYNISPIISFSYFIQLIPTMLIAVTYNKKKVQGFEFIFGITLSLGMIFFAAADFTVSPNFDFIGSYVRAVESLNFSLSLLVCSFSKFFFRYLTTNGLCSIKMHRT